MKPMLAFNYKDYQSKLTYPCFIQPKLNGIRMLYSNGLMQSRSHGREEPKRWPEHRLLHLRKALASVPDCLILDGELYIHGESLQRINALAGVNNSCDVLLTERLEYHVFDCIDRNRPDLGFHQRSEILYALSSRFSKSIEFVETNFISSSISGEVYYEQFKKEGYEGMMYRDPAAPYGLSEDCGNQENRWTRILKRKNWLDIELPILSWSFGIGKYENCIGSLDFEMPDGAKFSAGSGLSDRERTTLMEDWQGKSAKIKFLFLSDTGVPVEPTIEEIIE